MSTGGNFVRATLFGLFIGSILLGGGMVWKLGDQVRQIRIAERSDPHWIASQLQFEILRFNAELNEYVLGLKTREDVALRFDIAWSRINVMQAGKFTEIVESYDIDNSAVHDLEAIFVDLEPVILALPGPDSTKAARREITEDILFRINALDPQFRQLSLALAQAKSRFMSAYRQTLLSLSRGIAYLGIAILGIAAIFAALLMLDLKASKRTSRQMRQLAKEAQAAAKQKDNFMSVVSHELRTPLTSILGGLALLRMKHGKTMPEDAGRLVDIAHRNGERLMALVNDILDAQSLSEGKVSLERKEVDLNEIIADTVQSCQNYARQFDVSLAISPLPDRLPIRADARRISQVISNFLSNAAKFTSPGDIVRVRAYRVDRSVRVEVIDHGRGIPPEEHANLFTRFHQVNPGTTGPTKSSGLGLSICKQLIELHEGRIGFDSREGKGSIFWFELALLPDAPRPVGSGTTTRDPVTA
ncbi:sensor histidine kinase [Sulfitobacter aestuarii]|uniref:histidine kinase n=1 Tax=Sulfitobacter aestuarii TaxID=2161676 RepID=A0ABW5U2R8_9RHOB